MCVWVLRAYKISLSENLINDSRALRPERPFTGVSGPSGPEIPKKSRKESFWGLQKSPRKHPKKSKNTRKSPNLVFFGYFLTFSGIFGDFFADPQKDSFRDFFGISGPEGPETPLNGRSGCNQSVLKKQRRRRAEKRSSKRFFGVPKTVLLANRAFCPPEKGGF